MPAWKGIVGKVLKDPAQFAEYLETVTLADWRPKFVVVHNTSVPSMKTYNSWQARKPPISDEQWMRNLEGYYKGQGWAAGPHLFVTPRSILVFSPLTSPGTHSPAWNRISWGVETVGEFDEEPFEGSIRENLIGVLAALHRKVGLDPADYAVGEKGLHFHKEDPRTSHKSCPGRNLKKPELVAAVVEEMSRQRASKPVAPKPQPKPVVPKKPAPRGVAAWMPWLLEDEGIGLEIRATEPGGAVNMGVTMETFRQWRVRKGERVPSVEDLRVITQAEVAEIYESMYYAPVRADEMPAGVDYTLFDAAVNEGVGGATRLLQEVVGVKVDSKIGPITLGAVRAMKPKDLIEKYNALRLERKKARPTWDKFGDGWTARINRVRERSLKLVEK